MQIQHAYCSEDPLALSWHPEGTPLLALQAGPVLFRTGYERWLDTDAELDGGHIIGAVLGDQRAIVTG